MSYEYLNLEFNLYAKFSPKTKQIIIIIRKATVFALSPHKVRVSHGEVEDYPPVPEPSSVTGLLALGGLGLIGLWKRKGRS